MPSQIQSDIKTYRPFSTCPLIFQHFVFAAQPAQPLLTKQSGRALHYARAEVLPSALILWCNRSVHIVYAFRRASNGASRTCIALSPLSLSPDPSLSGAFVDSGGSPSSARSAASPAPPPLPPPSTSSNSVTKSFLVGRQERRQSARLHLWGVGFEQVS